MVICGSRHASTADDDLLAGIVGDRSLEQLVNTACLPGVVEHALAMPDMHQGYGFPIGAVVATRLPDGVISPGGVGYDINCGVRLLGSQLQKEQIHPTCKTWPPHSMPIAPAV